MCDAYTCACVHQLPFSMSFSRASAPLELVFFQMCGGPNIDSFDSKKYYVSFINNYSKF
jgi:hypothetical protein